MIKYPIVLAVCVLTLGIANAAQTTKPTPAATAPQTDEELARAGEALVNKVCSTSCHGLEKLDESRRTSRGWNDVVRDMANGGAAATEPQFATIRKYLARYYGVVDVNTAPAEEFSAVLGFSAKDAQAIVAYRTANGKFGDADALAKVPGIDKAKLTEQPEALKFK
jgi:competence protein ComEA